MLKYLKYILVPDKINNYFIFSQKRLGFDITKKQINTCQIKVFSKRNVVIEKCEQEFIEATNGTDAQTRIATALKNVILKQNKFDISVLALPSSLVIFKEITLPFLEPEQIRSVLDFEIEAALPFTIDEAVSDFIITKQDKKSKQSTILVAIARKTDIQEFIGPFKTAEINPTILTVDIFAIYGIYKEVPAYAKLENGVILIDLEFYYTTISYIQNGQLKLIRSVAQGISNITKNLANILNIDPSKALEYILRFGFENSDDQKYNDSIKQAFSEFSGKVQFTIESFKTQIENFTPIEKMVIVGSGLQIKKLCSIFNEKFNFNCEFFNYNLILQNPNFKNKEKNFGFNNLKSFAIAYPSPVNEDFNLLRKDFATTDSSLLNKQIITALSLVFLILFSLLIYSQSQISKFQRAVNNSKKEVISKLKDSFDITDPSTLKSLSSVISAANNKVNEEESIWFAFSDQTRFSFLKYLQELSTRIDRQAVGLDLKKLIITKELITIDGEVKDFKALETLENELNESKLFSHVSVPQETTFTIKITIKSSEVEQ